MSWRRVAWALRLYPRSWRKRYEGEVADLTHELIDAGEVTPSAAAAGLVGSAGRERTRHLLRARRGVITAVAVALALGGGAMLMTALVGSGKVAPPGPVDIRTVRGFVAVWAGSGHRFGYAPKRDLVVGLVAPVYPRDHKTLIGHEYPEIGFVPLVTSPWSRPCAPETVSANGTTSTVPCQGTVVVPDVVGMVTPTAVGELSGLGIAVVLYQLHSSTVAPGHIAATSPVAGTPVHHNQPVVVDLSVPDDVAPGWA